MLLFFQQYLLQYFPDWATSTASVEKITFRAAIAAMASFILAVIFGTRLIKWLNNRFREPIKSASLEVQRLHQNKQHTPTMGGLFIIGGVVLAAMIFGDLTNPFLLLALFTAVSLTILGAVDDLTKLKSNSRGLSTRRKLLWQIVIALMVSLTVHHIHSQSADGLLLSLPFHSATFQLGWWFVPLAMLVIVGSCNAVNLTDGLDGLAGGCYLFPIGAMGVVAYASGHTQWASYLGIGYIADAGEMTIFAAALIGGVLGFLWFNCHPAQVFMGDTGSLPLGGMIGLIAVICRQELLLIVIAGVFVIEALSVIIQVGSYKWRGRRVFLCAPLHHHFQLKGTSENKIVVRFWILSALCAVLGLASLKMSVNEVQKPAANVVFQTTVETKK